MPYQYGMQNSPSGGNGLGGLPKKQTTPKEVNFTRVLGAQGTVNTPTIGTITPPANAKYMRVAAIGAGGTTNGVNSGGAGGGGCAASKIVPAAPISYSIISADPAEGGGTVAVFPGYRLFGGRGSTNASRTGGTASGGDYNYSGGTGDSSAAAGAGGAAGPSGPGANGQTGGATLGRGWGVGGGGGGNNSGGGAGSGASAQGGFGAGSSVWGKPNSGRVGGELGGGGMAVTSTEVNFGGVGGIVVEWFYD